jgi:hypothetical protein
MFRGYFMLGGTEIVNSERVEAYVRNNLPRFGLVDCNDCSSLHEALGEGQYESPLVDDAPWVDTQNPATKGFFGVYPLALEGSLDDTTTAAVIESISDGGFVGSPRSAVREMRYRAMLIADDQLSLNAGMTWLKAALHPAPCDQHGGGCAGQVACFYAACPEVSVCYYDDAIIETPISVGQVTPDTPFSHTFRADELSQAWFRIPETDGLILRWGARSELGETTLEEHGPIVSKRTNVIPNPSFRNDTNGWSPIGGTTLSVVAGGVDAGGKYARVLGAAPGPIGMSGSPVEGFFGPVTTSFAMKAPAPISVTVKVLSDVNAVIASASYVLGTTWQRYAFTAGFGRRVHLSFEATAAAGALEFHVDQVLLEAGSVLMPYFDGDSTPYVPIVGRTATVDTSHYAIAWSGTPNNSASVMRWVSPADYAPGGGPFVGEQILEVGEQCDPGWRAFLEADAGSLPYGWMDSATRQAIPATEQVIPYERHFHDVTVIAGPTIINEFSFVSGAAVEVEWTMVAGTPFAYGATDDLLDRVLLSTVPTSPIDDLGVTCAVTDVSQIVDPDCPPVPPAPRPPAVPNVCIDDTTYWQRYSFDIPGDRVSGWSQMLPTVTLNSTAQAIRQVRVRVTPNPFDYPSATELSRRNLVYNPDFEANITNWTSTGAGSTITRDTTEHFSGVASLKVVTTAAIAGQGVYIPAASVAPITLGKNVAAQVKIKGAAGQALQMVVEQIDAANTVVWPNTIDITTTGAWQWISTAVVPVAAAVKTRIVVKTKNATAATFYLDEAQVESITGATVLPYISGDSNPDHGVYYSWDGVPHGSSSSGYHTSIDPCSYCAEFILSYLPPNAELTVDALTRTAFASVAGAPAQPATHLLYGTDGTPISWPSLSCGSSYVLTVDVPPGTQPNVAVSLSLTRQES